MNDYAQNVTTIHIGSDHAGFDLKEAIRKYLESSQYEVIDHGAFEYEESDDYPDFIAPVAREVAVDHHARGIILGGSGQGEAIVANRFPGVRAVVYYGEPVSSEAETPSLIVLSREHNDANVLSLGARFLKEEEAIEAVELWLETSFSGAERHVRRIEKIEEIGH